MLLQNEIQKFLPSYFIRYDDNKDVNGNGTMVRYQKMLASDIDDQFLDGVEKLHQDTKAVTMPTKFLPYEEDLRGTNKMIFEFAPF